MSQLDPLVTENDVFVFPASFGQERLWFLNQMEPESAFYNVPTVYRLRGTLDVGALERTLRELVERHESLRTTLAERDGAAVQVVHSAAGVALEVDDLSGAADRDEEARRRIGEEAGRPFDLGRGTLFRARLLRLEAEDHFLVLVFHHAVCDGWSLGVLFGELTALYEAFASGRPSPLAEPPLQYADFAVWQREHLSGQRLDAELDYWTERLAGAPAALDLPTDHARPPVQRHRGAACDLRVPVEVMHRVRALASREGATLFMAMLAAWQALLGKMSGQDDVVVGSPIAGRTRPELEGVVGFFVNMLALRTDLSGDPTFRQLLARVRETTLGAYQHQELPFERLVQELQGERSLSRNPLVQVVFALHNMPLERPRLARLAIEAQDPQIATAKVDLSLFAAEGRDALHLGASFDRDLFDTRTVERLLERFAALLTEVGEHPDRPLSQFAWLTDEERHRLLVEHNATERPVAPGRCVHHLFAEQARRTPHAPAVECGGAVLTYAELDARSNQLAHHLRARGVGPETPVAVLLPPTPELLVAILGVMKAGGAYLPLDPEHPPERLDLLLRESGAALVIADGVDALDAAIPVLPIGDAAIGLESAAAPSELATPQNLAYVVHTSGSTGTPKGVMIPHLGVVSYLQRVAEYAALTPADTTLQVAPVTFDASVRGLLAPLAAGARVLLPPPADAWDAGRLLELIDAGGLTAVVALVPSMLRELLRAADERGWSGGRLHTILLSGEPVHGDDVRGVRRVFGRGVRIVNQYGATECTMSSVAHRVEAEDAAPATGHPLPAGRPIGNSRAYVLDARLRPVPEGAAGEVYLGGIGVSRGYLGRPGLTAERFLPDPFTPGARLYRTGDRGRWTAAGTLEYLGRMDRQVKVNGVRVEPAEVEAALRGAPGVREAAVVLRAGRLAAFVAPRDVHVPTLREQLRRTLPAPLLPATITALESLPRTRTGKLDHGALPTPSAAGETEYEPPRTPTEERVAAIWAAVLGVERVGAHDSFFSLGGHSLLAMRAVTRLRGAFDADLPLRAIFEAPTVAELAAQLDDGARGGARLPPLVARATGGPAPLSLLQERLWFMYRMDPRSAAYNIRLAVALRGALDADAMARAVTEIGRRHEVLRTTVAEGPEGRVQRVDPSAELRLEIRDLSALPDEARARELRRAADAEAAAPFDLERGPPARVLLLRLAHEEHALLVTFHHLVSDGGSIGVFLRELAALYEAFLRGEPSPLPPLPVQYADYAVWQRQWLTGDARERQMEYWRGRLAGAPPSLDLPTDRARPAAQRFRGGWCTRMLPESAAVGARALSRTEGVTMYMTLLAAWQALLARYSGQDDVVVGSPIAGRTRLELEGLIGFFVNLVPLRTDLGGDPTFREILARVRETTLGAYAHADLPFDQVVEGVELPRAPGRPPLVQVTFNLTDVPDLRFSLPGVRLEPVDQQHEWAKFDLTLFAAEVPGGLRLDARYDADLFEAATVERMLARFGVLLEAACADPELRLADLPLDAELPLPAEDAGIFAEIWND